MSEPTKQTAVSIQERATAEFEQQHPRPQPPELPQLSRPSVLGIGTEQHAQMWLDVNSRQEYARGAHHMKLFVTLSVVEWKGNGGGSDQRIRGELTTEALDGLIYELSRVRTEIAAREAFAADTKAYEQQLAHWEQTKDEHVREAKLAWERAEAAAREDKGKK